MNPDSGIGYTATRPSCGILEIVCVMLIPLQRVRTSDILMELTILGSTVVNYLVQIFLYDRIACAYFDYKRDFKPVDIVRSILKYLVQRKGHVSTVA